MLALKPEDKFAKAFQSRDSSDAKITKPTASSYTSSSQDNRAATPLAASQSDGIVIIGRGTRIVGDLVDCSMLEIQGSVEGRISTMALVIREGGSVHGEIHAETAEIHGKLDGHVEVSDRLDVRSTGRVSGEVTYGTLAVALGGYVLGSITKLEPQPPVAPEVLEPAGGQALSTLMGIEVIRPSTPIDGASYRHG
jgi:cytoskeletal protein CcmA (bactofilin family)